MQDICVGDAIDGRVSADGEEDYVRENGEARLDARYHTAGAQRLDEQYERHDGEDVMMRRKGGEPVHGKIPDPYHQNW